MTDAAAEAEQLSAENRARHPDRRVTQAPSGRIRTVTTDTPDLDPKALEKELRAALEGEVRFDDGSRALYATDSSNYRQVPIGVVVPKTREDVVETVEICRRYGAPLLPRGGGTSLAGECCNVAVVIDFSKYLNRVLEIDPERRLARVEPGCILDDLRAEAAKHGLTFGPDPATHDHNTLGGMIGNNSCGVHAVMTGITVHNVQALEVLTYDGLATDASGRRARTSSARSCARAGGAARSTAASTNCADRYEPLIRDALPRDPAPRLRLQTCDQLLPENGFNVARALVGTEGTCVTVLEATAQPGPQSAPSGSSPSSAIPDIYQAADAVPRVLEHRPIGLEGFDQTMIDRYKTKGLHADDLKVLPEGQGWLLVEFGGRHRRGSRAKGAGARGRASKGRTASIPSSSATRTSRSASGTCATTRSAPSPTCRTIPTPGRAGRTAPCRPTSSATICAS